MEKIKTKEGVELIGACDLKEYIDTLYDKWESAEKRDKEKYKNDYNTYAELYNQNIAKVWQIIK